LPCIKLIYNSLQDASLEDLIEENKDNTKKAKKKKKAAYSKAVETMYRNAYRAQLDMISLAATKANIMISLNGFMVSSGPGLNIVQLNN